MRGPISIPQGFTLKAFGITSSVTQVDGFIDQAQLSVDWLPWLIEANSVSIDGNATLAIGGTGYGSGGIGLGPPATKVWLVSRADITVNVDPTEGIAFQVARTSNLGPGTNVTVGNIVSSDPLWVPIGATPRFPLARNDGMFFLRGRFQEQIGVHVTDFTNAGAFATTINAMYWEFDQ